MKQTVLIALLLPGLLVPFATTQAQDLSTQPAQFLVNEWFLRLNALDDWWISMDGAEENDAVVDRFMELYSEDAYHQVSPTERQIGQVVYNGPDKIRVWVDDFSKSFVSLEYRRDFRTQQEQTTQLIYVTSPPWGGVCCAETETTRVRTASVLRANQVDLMGASLKSKPAICTTGKLLRLQLYRVGPRVVNNFGRGQTSPWNQGA